MLKIEAFFRILYKLNKEENCVGRRFKNKQLAFMKKIGVRIFFLVGALTIFLVFMLVVLEICFYFQHGDFFFKKSIHFQLSKINEKNLLEKLPVMDESYKEKFFQVETNNNIVEKISMPSYIQPGKFAVMFGCWVWTKEPGKVRLVLLKNGESISSAYHSGNGQWEYLSVNAFADAQEYEIIITSRGASFKYHKLPILFSETRTLSKVHPQTRGEIFYLKNGKVRIVFIGGSTTFGTGTSHTEGTDYPYILQQMFDAIYPEQVNVLNYGLSAHSVSHFIPYKERIKILEADIVCIVPPWNNSLSYLRDRYIYKDKLINYSKWIDRLEQGIGNRIALGYYLKNIFTGLHNKVTEELLTDYEDQVHSKGQSSTFYDAFGTEILKNPPFNYGFYCQLNLLTDILKNQGSRVYYGLLPFYANRKEIITDEDIDLLKQIRVDAKALVSQIQMTIPLSKMDRSVVLKASKRNQTPFIDLVHYYAFDQVVPRRRFDYFADPVHLSRAGNIFVAKGFFEALIDDVGARLKNNEYAYFFGGAANPPADMDIMTIKGKPCLAENKELITLPWIPVDNFQIIGDLIRTMGTGVIRTKPIVIEGSFLRFKLMGDSDINDPDVCGIKFYVDGKLIRSVTSACSTKYCETYVDMRDYIGKEVVLEIIDKEHDPKIALYDASFE